MPKWKYENKTALEIQTKSLLPKLQLLKVCSLLGVITDVQSGKQSY